MTEDYTAPPAPDELGESGRKLWDDYTSKFEFEEHELALLVEAARVKDRLDALDKIIRSEGMTVQSPHGPKAHPALVEARQQEIVLTRIVASLRLPDEDDERPQRRGGARGAYAARRAYGSLSVGR